MGIKDYRKKVDKIDEKIAKLISKRQGLVKNIRKKFYKNNMKFRDKKREKEIINNLKKFSKNKNHHNLLKKIYRHLFEFGLSIMA